MAMPGVLGEGRIMTIQIDPYNVLGVARDADEATIRKAYRKKSKAAHPDAGGNPETWEKVATSLMVLTDPDLRRGFDETGKIGEKAIDNDRAAALQLIDQQVAALINQYITNGFSPQNDPRKKNIPRALVEHFNNEIYTAEDAIATGANVIKFYEDMQRRFTVVDQETVPENSIAKMLGIQISQAKQQVSGLEKNITIRKMAIQIIEAYRFEFDAPPPMATSYYDTNPSSPYVWPQAGFQR
jgi:hypothetical protein